MTASTWRGWSVAGCRVLMVGCPAWALPDAVAAVEAEARLTLLRTSATELPPTVADLVQRGYIHVHDGPLEPAMAGASLVVVAESADQELVVHATSQAREQGLPVLELSPPHGGARVTSPGRVTLVGGGPGAEDLLTLRGLRALQSCDVVVVDRLAPIAALTQLQPAPRVIDVSKIPRGDFTPQEDINAILVREAQAGHRVVRLKGGDGFVFGRGMEEAEACLDAGVPVEVVPGLSSAIAGPALAGVPITHRGLTQGFTVVSGHVPPGDERGTVDWQALAGTDTTVVVMMGVQNLQPICRTLAEAGRVASTPVAIVQDAAHAHQRVWTATVGELALNGRPAELTPPAIIVIGEVASFAGRLNAAHPTHE